MSPLMRICSMSVDESSVVASMSGYCPHQKGGRCGQWVKQTIFTAKLLMVSLQDPEQVVTTYYLGLPTALLLLHPPHAGQRVAGHNNARYDCMPSSLIRDLANVDCFEAAALIGVDHQRYANLRLTAEVFLADELECGLVLHERIGHLEGRHLLAELLDVGQCLRVLLQHCQDQFQRISLGAGFVIPLADALLVDLDELLHVVGLDRGCRCTAYGQEACRFFTGDLFQDLGVLSCFSGQLALEAEVAC